MAEWDKLLCSEDPVISSRALGLVFCNVRIGDDIRTGCANLKFNEVKKKKGPKIRNMKFARRRPV